MSDQQCHQIERSLTRTERWILKGIFDSKWDFTKSVRGWDAAEILGNLSFCSSGYLLDGTITPILDLSLVQENKHHMLELTPTGREVAALIDPAILNLGVKSSESSPNK